MSPITNFINKINLKNNKKIFFIFFFFIFSFFFLTKNINAISVNKDKVYNQDIYSYNEYENDKFAYNFNNAPYFDDEEIPCLDFKYDLRFNPEGEGVLGNIYKLQLYISCFGKID